MNASRSIFKKIFPPLHMKQDKTLEPFTSLIQIYWIHSWPQGASSHCSFSAVSAHFTLHCTGSADWPASGKSHCCLVGTWVSVLSHQFHRLCKRAIISFLCSVLMPPLRPSHIWWTRRTNQCGCRLSGRSAGLCAVVRPHSWVYTSLIIPPTVHTKSIFLSHCTCLQILKSIKEIGLFKGKAWHFGVRPCGAESPNQEIVTFYTWFLCELNKGDMKC